MELLEEYEGILQEHFYADTNFQVQIYFSHISARKNYCCTKNYLRLVETQHEHYLKISSHKNEKYLPTSAILAAITDTQ
jgi:hypothetical protein